MTKLNPCPDCGREPDFEERGKTFRVACWHCSSTEFITARTASGAINAWNAATGDGTTNQSGKTLRDEFAMAALVPVYAHCANKMDLDGYPDENWRDGIAKDVYAMADAMLKERNK